MKKENLKLEIPNLRNISTNKTTKFLLPSISLLASKTSLKMLEYYGFVNCYIEHKQTHFYASNYLYLVLILILRQLRLIRISMKFIKLTQIMLEIT